jgi:hypothetical protein
MLRATIKRTAAAWRTRRACVRTLASEAYSEENKKKCDDNNDNNN